MLEHRFQSTKTHMVWLYNRTTSSLDTIIVTCMPSLIDSSLLEMQLLQTCVLVFVREGAHSVEDWCCFLGHSQDGWVAGNSFAQDGWSTKGRCTLRP